ncbi:uncharacterized protein FIBRA_00569 [Fibroporia radiculosa]|uniref:Fungal-type protein kinase domain-containing protein n=1 Tax=Fibroporia radiculosa TaxID=599839 RepID=J4H090_9APHY|nr:uncharacterized protein FIBRA_00569 [Fibroporia radiculosa]CCL98569.1 predicted protein [Fibroporia radiculosa]
MPPYNAPIAKNANGSQRFGFDSKHADARGQRHAAETHTFLGPMPVQDFLNAFLPKCAKKSMPSSKGAFKDIPEAASDERDIYAPLVYALNADGKRKRSRCPGFIFDITTTRGESNATGSMRPDVCCYVETIIDDTRAKNGAPRAHLGYAELFIEVKREAKQDFFTDPEPGADRTSHQFVLNMSNDKLLKNARKALGQNIAYATEACARQHRTFYFSISVSGNHARLIRWDRAGSIVTEDFDLHEDPQFLCEFLWRFSHSMDAQRGYDMTVEPASPEEEALFRDVIKTHVQEQLLEDVKDPKSLKRAIDNHYLANTVVAVKVDDEQSGGVHRYLISRPVVSPLSMASRATRGYWAVRDDGQIAFLKDTWRYEGDDFEKEGEILIALHKAGVRNIPKLLHHGDVLSQQHPIPKNSKGKQKQSATDDECIHHTLTDKYLDAEWVCTGGVGGTMRQIVVTPHVHYRVTLGTVGYPLDQFRGTEELLYSTHCGYQAMIDAYDKSGRLHRDISLGNIILYRDRGNGVRRGILIDWELSCRLDDKGQARKYERTGTWQFMSINQLNVRKPTIHTLQDDMESILYVVLYCSIRWGAHNVDDNTVFDTIRDMFDSGNDAKGGGTGKVNNMANRRYTEEYTFKSSALHRWLNTAMDYHYPVDRDKERKWSDPTDLDRLWVTILKEPLEKNDRVDRRADDRHAPKNAAGNASGSTPGNPLQATMVSGSMRLSTQSGQREESLVSAGSARKRAHAEVHFEQDVLDHGRGSKRRRTIRSVSRGDLAQGMPPVEPRPASPLRRSTRSGQPSRASGLNHKEGASSLRRRS